jgi:iron complex outermembrane receptor protein
MNKIILGTLIWACLFAVGLTAQTQEEQSDIEVVVTASRVEEPAEEVPAYVSVITSEELTASGQTTLVEALDGLAGIRFRSTSGNAAQAEISMRGFGENSHGRVLVLLDGRRLNRPDMASINWLEIPLENIERIEVVRGGSSVMYGDNAVVGVINIITKKGAAGFDVAVSGQYGSFNQNQEGVEISGSSGPLSYSITRENTATDGYRDRSAFESLAFGGNVGLDFERLSSGLSLSYNRLFYEMPGALTKTEFDADSTQAQPFYNVAQANNQYFNSDLAFSCSPSERWLVDGHLSYGLKFIQTDFDYDDGMFPWSSFTDLTINTIAFTPNTSMNFDLLYGNRLVLGIDCYMDVLGLKTFPDIDRIATTMEARLTRALAGIYATNDLSLLSFLTATVGVRYELVRIAAETVKTSGTPFDETQVLHSFVYDTGLLLTPFRNSKLWVKYGTVFHYPFTDEMVDFYGLLAQPFNTSLRPEQGHQLDFGAEILLFGLLKLVACGFWLNVEDEIAYDSATKLNINLDKTQRFGVEAEIGLTIPSWLHVSGSYTYTFTEFREGAYADKKIPLVPAHQASGEASLLLPLGFSLGTTGQYMGEQYFGSDPDNAQGVLPDYFLIGAFIKFEPSYITGELEVFFGIENILDARYATTGFYDEWGGQVYYYPGEGRNWKVGASYRY